MPYPRAVPSALVHSLYGGAGGAKKRAERLLRKLWFTTSLYFPKNWNQLFAGHFWNH